MHRLSPPHAHHPSPRGIPDTITPNIPTRVRFLAVRCVLKGTGPSPSHPASLKRRNCGETADAPNARNTRRSGPESLTAEVHTCTFTHSTHAGEVPRSSPAVDPRR